MPYEKPKVFKVSGGIPYSVNEEVDKYASLAGISKMQFVGILVQLGLNAWIRTYSPEKLLSSTDWEKLIEMMENRQKTKDEESKKDA